VERRTGFVLGVAAALAISVAGCSSGAEELTVTGKVTLDGAPLKSGQIRFVMADGQGPTAGAVITDGQYSAVLSPGEKTVEIRAAVEGPARAMYGQAPATPSANSGGGEMIPARYNDQTELKAQVDADHVEHNFELQSK
jgi:hypothetical protein